MLYKHNEWKLDGLRNTTASSREALEANLACCVKNKVWFFQAMDEQRIFRFPHPDFSFWEEKTEM